MQKKKKEACWQRILHLNQENSLSVTVSGQRLYGRRVLKVSQCFSNKLTLTCVYLPSTHKQNAAKLSLGNKRIWHMMVEGKQRKYTRAKKVRHGSARRKGGKHLTGKPSK